MSLQLKDVFTSKGMRCREVQQQSAVDYAAIVCVKVGERRKARFGLSTAESLGETEEVSPGYTDDPDTAAALRRGNGGDRFSGC